MTRKLKMLLVAVIAVILGAALIGAPTPAGAKSNPGPSSKYVTGTVSGTDITSFSCDGTEPDPDDVVVELLFHVNAKGLGKGTMHYGPQSVGPADGTWAYSLDNGRGALTGTARLKFWGGAGIMTVNITLGTGQFSGVTSGALSSMVPLGEGSEDLCATPTVVAEYEGVISGVLNYG